MSTFHGECEIIGYCRSDAERNSYYRDT